MLLIFLCLWGMIAVFSHPFPLVPCLKYFLANSSMSYWLSCSALSSRSPSANPSRETLWRFKKGTLITKVSSYFIHFAGRWKKKESGTSMVWSISCAAMVDATATATAEDAANWPAPPRGSAVRSSGSDRKSGAAIGWTHSAGKEPERLNTAPNFQPGTWSGEIRTRTPGAHIYRG